MNLFTLAENQVLAEGHSLRSPMTLDLVVEYALKLEKNISEIKYHGDFVPDEMGYDEFDQTNNFQHRMLELIVDKLMSEDKPLTVKNVEEHLSVLTQWVNRNPVFTRILLGEIDLKTLPLKMREYFTTRINKTFGNDAFFLRKDTTECSNKEVFQTRED